MEGSGAKLGSPEWWGSVVCVGILIHLAAGYVKPVLDRRFGWLGGKWAARSERSRGRFAARVVSLRGISSEDRIIAAINAASTQAVGGLILLGMMVFTLHVSTLAPLLASYLGGYALSVFVLIGIMGLAGFGTLYVGMQSALALQEARLQEAREELQELQKKEVVTTSPETHR